MPCPQVFRNASIHRKNKHENNSDKIQYDSWFKHKWPIPWDIGPTIFFFFFFFFSKKVYCCTRKYKSQFTNADINSHSVHGNGGKHAVCTFFICENMLLPITYPLKNTDITQRIVCHAQQWGQRNPSGLMGPKSDTFNQVICSVHKGQSGKISQ